MDTVIDKDWRILNRSLVDKLKYIFDSSFLTDLTIRIICEQPVEFHVHSIVLSMASAVFEAMMISDLQEGKTKVVELMDVQPNVFKILLQHIYGQIVYFCDIKQAWEVFVVADKYFIYDLKDICLDHIREHINPEFACYSFEMAQRYDILDIKEKSLMIIQESTTNVVGSEHFLNVNQNIVMLILDQNKLNIKEIDLFLAIEKWVKSFLSYNGEVNKEALCGLIMSKFNFFNMTIKEFTEGPVRSNLLSKDEILTIYAHMSSPNCDLFLPQYFTKNKLLRTIEISTDPLCRQRGEIPKEGCGFRVLFSADRSIKLAAIKIFTQEGIATDKYNEKIIIKIKIEGDDMWEFQTTHEEKVVYSSFLLVHLNPPFQISKGRKYDLFVGSKAGLYTVVKLSDSDMKKGDLSLLFFKHPNTVCFLPLASVFVSF